MQKISWPQLQGKSGTKWAFMCGVCKIHQTSCCFAERRSSADLLLSELEARVTEMLVSY